MEEILVGRIVYRAYRKTKFLYIRPYPNLYRDDLLNKLVSLKIVDGELAGTILIARVKYYPSRKDYGVVFMLSHKMYSDIGQRYKGRVVRFKILDVLRG